MCFTSALVLLQDGDTPLHIASANDHEVVVEVLLKGGAYHSNRNWVSMIQLYFEFLIVNLNVLYKCTCVITVRHTSTQSIS